MRLLRTDTLELVEFVGRVPPYVILSHTWGPDEVSFEDLPLLPKAALKKKAGYSKILGCSSRAAADGYEYVWVDTCCINKSSSAELSEAINSMYRWYQEAHICYAYMSDVSLDVDQGIDPVASTTQPAPKKGASDSPPTRPTYRTIPSILREYDKLPRTFENSKWFTRGWTLQELIAPSMVEFYAHDWREIGTKFSLRKVIGKVTGIDVRVLEGTDPSTCHVAERMSWAANRQTTRVEDAAYCLLGIFKVHMPLIYGEGQRAFYRLQKEIMKTAEDYTMLAWGLSKYLSNKHHWKGIHRSNLGDPRRPLADSPNDFELHNRTVWTYSRLIADETSTVATHNSPSLDDTPPLITSRGLRVSLLLKRSDPRTGDILAYINCKTSKPGASPEGPLSPVCLVLRRQEESNIYTGSDDPNAAFELLESERTLASFEHKTIYLSLASADSALSQTHNHRISSLEKNLYILEKPPPLRAGESAISLRGSWKITSCFSHAVGSGPGHMHYEVPRKFTAATLFHPFDLPPSTIRLFAFEQPQIVGGRAFGIVVGHGWCDVIAIADVAFRAKWGSLVRDGYWNEVLALKFIGHVSTVPKGQSPGGEDGDESADRVTKRITDFTVSLSLKKIRRADINCESAIRIMWTVTLDDAYGEASL
ncbi:heterokaryon incompatibility protein-domain-containing protein [Chaetomidium leptoderma]|uniref:Heterokaryon incompatibility protein-domain-containing protein n=1 Tax=Chaetomidium leptoderma TaxID=669021 RepID=A0AAN6VIQ6_9PEZI|nr:heterokaryon incompatibility protein-domain-containing protein [Chaetomidium leptoderma]